jgi:hypothetical protein
MQVRCSLRWLEPNERLSISRLWAEGHPSIYIAYNRATAQPPFEGFHLSPMQRVFWFVGGRSSLVRFFANDENQGVFVAQQGSSIGLIVDRKQYALKKDKTLVGVCNAALQCQYPVRPLRDFAGVPNVAPPLDPNGGGLTTKQLATILYYEFRQQRVVGVNQVIDEILA